MNWDDTQFTAKVFKLEDVPGYGWYMHAQVNVRVDAGIRDTKRFKADGLTWTKWGANRQMLRAYKQAKKWVAMQKGIEAA